VTVKGMPVPAGGPGSADMLRGANRDRPSRGAGSASLRHMKALLLACSWAVVCALAFPGSGEAASADGYAFLGTSLIVPNYLQIPVGEWEALEGGAYVARSRDGNSNWYNPAGLALVERTAVNASANAYESTTLEYKTFATTDRSLRLAGVGGFFGVAIAEPIASSPRLRYGLYIARPLAWASGTVDATSAPDAQTDVRLISTGQLNGTEPGIAAGYRLSEHLRLGASLAVVDAQMSEAMDANLRRADADSVRTYRRTLAQEGSAWYGVARAGFQWDPSEHLRVGVTASSPGMQITGSTKFDYTFEDHSPTHLIDERFRDTEAKFDYKVPYRLAAGVAARFDRGEFEVSVRYFGSTSPYDMISTTVPAERVEQLEGGAPVVTYSVPSPLRNEWRAVTNFAVGGNYVLNDVVRLHLGFQTDRSPVGDAGSVLFRKIDLYGGTGGVSFNSKRFTGTLGLGYFTGESDPIESSVASEPTTQSRIRLTTLRGMYSLSVRF
jgi:long-subunit fatty acid transport protein